MCQMDGDMLFTRIVVDRMKGQEVLPIWHGMNYYTFAGRSMSSLPLRLHGSTSPLC